LAQNVPIYSITTNYILIYNKTYSHRTTNNELKLIRDTCSEESTICVGGTESNTDKVELLSCGNCWKILNKTSINNPIKENGAYWYNTNNKSM
jgi:hypothetical protein